MVVVLVVLLEEVSRRRSDWGELDTATMNASLNPPRRRDKGCLFSLEEGPIRDGVG
jgi:hypothetical protein